MYPTYFNVPVVGRLQPLHDPVEWRCLDATHSPPCGRQGSVTSHAASAWRPLSGAAWLQVHRASYRGRRRLVGVSRGRGAQKRCHAGPGSTPLALAASGPGVIASTPARPSCRREEAAQPDRPHARVGQRPQSEARLRRRAPLSLAGGRRPADLPWARLVRSPRRSASNPAAGVRRSWRRPLPAAAAWRQRCACIG